MEKSATFYEVQHFRQWWLWVLLIALGVLFGYACYYQLGTGEAFGDKPMGDIGLVLTTLFMLMLIALFWFQGMHTRVDSEGIHIRFRPYHRKWKTFRWEDITHSEVKKFNPFFDYGGWGIKNGSYTVQGNMGVQLKFARRDSVMIGTQKPDVLKDAIKAFGNRTINQPT